MTWTPRSDRFPSATATRSRHVLLLLALQCQSLYAFPATGLPLLKPQSGALSFSRAPTTTTTTKLAAELNFSGDSTASLEFETGTSIESVQKWLDTPQASDVSLLGSDQVKQIGPDLWECLQPRIDFMGLDLQPSFTHRIGRKQGIVTVQVIDSRTDVLSNNNPANQIVASLMSRAKFSGKSVIRAKPKTAASSSQTTTDPCGSILQVDLTLTLNIPLPPFILLPPGFNSLGSAMVKRTGNSRTKKLLEELKSAYYKWAKEAPSTATSSSLDSETKNS